MGAPGGGKTDKNLNALMGIGREGEDRGKGVGSVEILHGGVLGMVLGKGFGRGWMGEMGGKNKMNGKRKRGGDVCDTMLEF